VNTSFHAEAHPVAPPPLQKKDNRFKAILAMNLFCIGSVAQSACFKIVQKEGVKLYDYQIFRNFSVVVVSMIWLYLANINPIRDFPSSKSKTVITRSLLGQVSFFVFNLSLTMVPMTLHIILFQTNTFWISLLAYFFLAEPIICQEFVGMAICFVAVIFITTAKDPEAAADGAAELDSMTRTIGFIMILCGSWIFATINILNRVLKELHHA